MSVKSFKTSGIKVDLAPQGLVLLNTTSFSGVSSQSVNDVFSATYDSYFLISQVVASTTADIQLRVRVGGADLTTSTYIKGEYYIGLRENAAFASATNSTSTNLALVGTDSGYPSFSYVQISQPFLADETVINSQSSGRHTRTVGGMVNNNTSYTGFTLLASTGTITGSVSVFGYLK